MDRLLRSSLPVLLAGAAALTASAEVTDRIVRTVAISPGTPISVQVTIGDVQVSAWPRHDVSIDIARRAPDAERLARVPAQVEESDEGLRVRAQQVDDGRDPAIRTDVTLRVPAAAHLHEVAAFEGRVRLSGLKGRVSAHVERGGIVAAGMSGVIRLETAIGDIRLDAATLAPDGLLRLRTFNGDVSLELAAPPEHARILALSMGGRVASDIPLTMREGWGPRFGEATLGSGGPVISIDVVNGDVVIRLPRQLKPEAAAR